MTHEISRGARKLSRTPTLIRYIYIYIVNFRIYRINRDMCKLIQKSILIKEI